MNIEQWREKINSLLSEDNNFKLFKDYRSFHVTFRQMYGAFESINPATINVLDHEIQKEVDDFFKNFSWNFFLPAVRARVTLENLKGLLVKVGYAACFPMSGTSGGLSAWQECARSTRQPEYKLFLRVDIHYGKELLVVPRMTDSFTEYSLQEVNK